MADSLQRRDWVFPMDCAACRRTAGHPYRAETLKLSGSIRVSLRCHECGHEWQADLLADPTPLRPLASQD